MPSCFPGHAGCDQAEQVTAARSSMHSTVHGIPMHTACMPECATCRLCVSIGGCVQAACMFGQCAGSHIWYVCVCVCVCRVCRQGCYTQAVLHACMWMYVCSVCVLCAHCAPTGLCAGVLAFMVL